MIEVTSQQGAVLAFLSVSTLGFICALCVRCRKKSMIVQENNQLYIPQVFHREGSMFAVTRSKTVTKTNQMSTDPCQSSGNFAHTFHSQLDSAFQDSGGSYQNIPKPTCSSTEPTYVDPIATPPNKVTVLDDDAGDYANIFPTQDVDHDSDSYDYENTEFLQNSKIDDDDEPDYVNAETTH
ncbi:hypothetical protein PGIGA_G00063950 [Pangasianodon gigas]|uniref:Uncharacterized protein n=1 Tax=Pangasianodon gigas TaxID=30993 RepID=A0ACC5X6J1_PANGG|nr:hypothetical protein [Pangasianodon gigas]